jgi:hypothetical protein
MENKGVNILDHYNVPTTNIVMPSGFTVEIREQNGDDDDVLSRIQDVNDGSSVHKFIAGIIMSHSLGTTKLTATDILNWKLQDKYYLLFKSRLFSLGKDIVFTHKFPDGTTIDFEEDLSIYDWDLSKPLPPEFIMEGDKKKPNPEYFKYRITPHAGGSEPSRTLTLSSKKIVKYDYITGVGEYYLLQKNQDDVSKNDELRARNLQMNIDGKFQTIEVFKLFNPTDMREIREDMEKYDSLDFRVLCDVTSPKDGYTETISLIMNPSFFFPTKGTTK